MRRMNKPYFLAYDDDLRRFCMFVSFQSEDTPCVIGLYAVCTFLHPLFPVVKKDFPLHRWGNLLK